MTNIVTHKPLRVSSSGGAGGEIMLPVNLLGEVRRLLDSHGVAYWVDEEAFSIDGGPEVTFITLSVKNDPEKVQQLLDSVP